uniref:(northern house mosquito) hypothetical protein n=1 Tax=Culex pipiens TaxID=7175 RepID=A0A8D8MCD6_CULPI
MHQRHPGVQQTARTSVEYHPNNSVLVADREWCVLRQGRWLLEVARKVQGRHGTYREHGHQATIADGSADVCPRQARLLRAGAGQRQYQPDGQQRGRAVYCDVRARSERELVRWPVAHDYGDQVVLRHHDQGQRRQLEPGDWRCSVGIDGHHAAAVPRRTSASAEDSWLDGARTLPGLYP